LIVPINHHDLWHSPHCAGIHLTAHCEPTHHPRGRLSDVDLPPRYYHFRLQRRTRDDKAPGIGKVPGKDGAQEGGSAERVTDGDDLLTRCRRDGLHKRGDVVRPLRPRIHMATLAGALAMAAQIDCVGAETALRHRIRERRITAGMLTE